MSTTGEIAIQARFHPSRRWITIPLVVGGRRLISAVLDTGSPVSAISPRIERVLSGDGLLLPSARPNRRRLADLRVQGQPLPDLEVAVLNRLDRLAVDGLLGLDFLTHFEHIHFHTRALQLILDPA